MTQQQNEKTDNISHGVETLIAKLKSEGVSAGKQEAENIIKQAQDQANKILNSARAEAETLINQAYKKIQQEKQAAEDALQLSARNMRLELRQQLINRFKNEVKRLVHKELANEKTIQELILILTLDTAEKLQKYKEKRVKIALPATVLDFEEIRHNPKLLEQDPLKELVQGITHQMLRQGMNIIVNPEHNKEVGIKIYIVDDNIEIDLSQEAISELLLKHMQPRFRALLEGLLQ